MPKRLDTVTREQLASRINYYREMGIYDFYRRPIEEGSGMSFSEQVQEHPPEPPEIMPSNRKTTLTATALPVIQDRPEALKAIRAEIGECTRCRLHKGRTNLVFGVGKVSADLMFVGEGPGADEDAQGEPFVGRAGQLLNNMISAMGLEREDVYIANVVKCRPPNNRTPEKDECDT